MSSYANWSSFNGRNEDKEELMEVAEKVKITEAMKLCENKMLSFFKYLDDSLSEEDSLKLKDFLITNTFFAGGVFRSVFSGTVVNDVDVFFKSYDAVIEFKHMVMSQTIKLFKEVSDNGSFNWKPGKGPKLSFITMSYGHPESVIKRFDLSFNQHYYDMQRMEMWFDRDTFNMVGWLNPSADNKPNSVLRALRFLNEGWKIDQESIMQIIKLYWNEDTPIISSTSSKYSPEKLGLTKKVYTDREFFGKPANKEKKPKYTLNSTPHHDEDWLTQAAQPVRARVDEWGDLEVMQGAAQQAVPVVGPSREEDIYDLQ